MALSSSFTIEQNVEASSDTGSAERAFVSLRYEVLDSKSYTISVQYVGNMYPSLLRNYKNGNNPFDDGLIYSKIILNGIVSFSVVYNILV